MYLGRIVEQAPTDALFASPRHPYTQALLAAVPEVGQAPRAVAPIEGEPSSAVRLPAGCRFHPRCPIRVDRCLRESPPLLKIGAGRLVACHLAGPA
jgi:oligopeptide/dipeptide ABC transporter ATP-binding protein